MIDTNPSVLWLILARSGSKGVPNKNIRPLGGVPLLAWRIHNALPLKGEVWLSTDSDRYAAIGKKYGAQVPFLRPAELSGDTATSVDACLHAMHYAESIGKKFDMLCLLQPTSPFVRTESLQKALLALKQNPEADSAVAVKKVHPSSFFIQEKTQYLDMLARRFAQAENTRRQDIPAEITPCGGFFFIYWNNFLENLKFYTEKTIPIVLDENETLDIDSELDFKFAEYLLQSNKKTEL